MADTKLISIMEYHEITLGRSGTISGKHSHEAGNGVGCSLG
ncbi:hypothetical protein [Paraburkholderia phenoliruptrix]